MARAIWLPGGGGADLDVVTADAGDVLAGKVIVGPDGEPLTGTLALSGNASDGQVLSGQTYYNTDAKTKRTGTMPNRGAVNQSLAINGSYTIPAGYHNGSGKVTQNIPTKGAQTYTPGTANQTIAAGQYLTGAQTIKGEPNLKPENIREGVIIFGKKGTVIEYKTPASMPSYEGTLTYHNGTAIIDFDSNSLRITQNAFQGAQSIARFNTAVNLSGWNYINVKVSTNGRVAKVYIGISKNTNVQSFSFDTQWIGTNPNTSGYVKLNVSSFSGIYYLYIGMQTINDPGSGGTAYASNVTFSTQ